VLPHDPSHKTARSRPPNRRLINELDAGGFKSVANVSTNGDIPRMDGALRDRIATAVL